MPEIIQTIKALKEVFPLFGVGLGHELLAIACGAKMEKLYTGQYGMNIPVTDLQAEKTSFTTMSHDYAVDEASLPEVFEITHRSLHDGKIAGLKHKQEPVWGVQFHPEGAPGSNEMNQLFTTFLDELVQTQRINGGRQHA